jgi:hypothetical protein
MGNETPSSPGLAPPRTLRPPRLRGAPACAGGVPEPCSTKEALLRSAEITTPAAIGLKWERWQVQKVRRSDVAARCLRGLLVDTTILTESPSPVPQANGGLQRCAVLVWRAASAYRGRLHKLCCRACLMRASHTMRDKVTRSDSVPNISGDDAAWLVICAC